MSRTPCSKLEHRHLILQNNSYAHESSKLAWYEIVTTNSIMPFGWPRFLLYHHYPFTSSIRLCRRNPKETQSFMASKSVLTPFCTATTNHSSSELANHAACREFIVSLPCANKFAWTYVYTHDSPVHKELGNLCFGSVQYIKHELKALICNAGEI